MNFRINLKPFPGAEYFTVQVHLKNYSNSMGKTGDLKKEVESKLKKLFKIPENFAARMVLAENPVWSIPDYEVLVKDDPKTGVTMIRHISLPEREGAILDLSYSFPQITGDLEGFSAIFIRPAASLGIPSEWSVVFIRPDVDKMADSSGGILKEENYQKSMYVMNAVLGDYLEKGVDVLFRESNYKAAVLYQLLETSKNLNPVAAKAERSKTMITAFCEPEFLLRIHKLGYDLVSTPKDGKQVLTIANYPTHSKEAIEMFADRVAAL